mgnify:CR=1 FL=1
MKSKLVLTSEDVHKMVAGCKAETAKQKCAATIAVVPKPDSITTRLARLVLTPIDRMLQTRA